MPTEKIKYSDNLKQGTDKLNSAIEAANAAETLSTNADTKATQALSNSVNTQEQLDTIVVEGDSSVEAAQARVPVEGTAYPTLKARLDAEYNGLTADLAETSSDLESRELNVLFPPTPLVGAVGDGVTDDTNALIAIRDYIITNGGTLFVPSNANCYIPNGIDLFGLRHIKIEGTLTGVDTTKELIVGYNSGVTLPFKCHVNRLVSLKLKVQGLKNGDVTVNTAPHLLLWADSAIADIGSMAYNNFYLGKVDHFEINSLGSGWINENKIFGGRLTKVTITGDGGYAHNHNVFYSPTLENSTIDINIGTSNRLLGCRFEGTNTITFGSSTWDNEIVRSWHNAPGSFLRGQARTSYTDNGKGNIVANAMDSYHDRTRLYSLNYNSMNYDISEITRNGDNTLSVTTTGQFKNMFESGFIPVDFDFGVEINSDATLWRAIVEFYDSTMTRIVTDVPNAISSGELVWSTANNHYWASVNKKNILFAVFKNTTVKYIKIRLQAHATGAFKYLDISFRKPQYLNMSFDIVSTYKKLRSSSVPTTGNWKVGDVVYNKTPIAGGYTGWICVADGSPGTWKGFGLIQS